MPWQVRHTGKGTAESVERRRCWVGNQFGRGNSEKVSSIIKSLSIKGKWTMRSLESSAVLSDRDRVPYGSHCHINHYHGFLSL